MGDGEAVAIAFQGIDDGLGDLITSMQSQLQGLLALAQSADFAAVSQGGQAFQTLAGGAQAATAAVADYVPAATAAASATNETGAASERGKGQIQGMRVEADALKESVRDLAGNALPGLNTAIGASSALTQSWKSSGDAEVSTLATMGAGLAAVGVVAAGITFEGFISGAENIHRLALESGMSAAAVAGLQTVMESVGVSGDRMQSMVMMASRQLQAMQDQVDKGQEPTGRLATALQTLGIDALDSAGNVRSFGDLLPEILDKFAAAKDAAAASGQTFNAAGLAVELFGRSGAQLVPMLEAGSAALKDETARAQELGIGSEQQIQHLEAWKKAQADLHLEIQGFVMTVGSAVAPVLTTFVQQAQAAMQVLNALPAPVRELVVVLPLVAGGFLLIVAAAQAASAAALAFAAVNPILLGFAAAITVGVVAAELLSKVLDPEGSSAQKAYASSVTATNKALDDQVSAMQQAGASTADIADKLHADVAAYSNAWDDAQHKLNAFMAQFDQQTQNLIKDHGLIGTTAKQTLQTYDDLTGGVRQQAAAYDTAVQKSIDYDKSMAANAQVATEVKSRTDAYSASLNQAALAAQADVTAETELNRIAKETVTSENGLAAVEGALKDAVAISTMTTKDRTTAEQGLDAMIKSGDPTRKTYAEDVKTFVGILQNLTPQQAEMALQQARVNDELSKMNGPGIDAKARLDDIDRAFQQGAIDADKYATALADAFSKPTVEELKLRQAIDANKIAISQWDAVVAESSPIDQRIASLQKELDQQLRTGASVEQTKKTEADLAAQLAAVPAQEGAAVVAGQQRVDNLNVQQGALTAQQRVLQDERTASHDAAEAAGTHALAIEDVTSRIDPLTGKLNTDLIPTTQHLADVTNAAKDGTTGLSGAAQAAPAGLDALGASAKGNAGQVDILTASVNQAISAINVLSQMKLPFGSVGGTSGGPGGETFPGTGSLATQPVGDGLSMQQIAQGLAASGFPGDIAKMTAILWAESGGSPDAGSAAGALGVGQFMPATAAGVGLTNRQSTGPDLFAAITKLYGQSGYSPWDAYSYVAGNGPYGEAFVGAGQGSFNQFLSAAQAAVGTAGIAAPGGQLPVPDPNASGGTPNLSGLTAQQQAAFNNEQKMTVDMTTVTHDLATATDTYNKALAGVTDKTTITQEDLDKATGAHQGLVDTMTTAYTNYQAAATALGNLAQSGAATPDQLTAAQNALTGAKTAFGDAAKAVNENNTAIATDTKTLHDNQVNAINDLGTALETAYKTMYGKEKDAALAAIDEQKQAWQSYVTKFGQWTGQMKQYTDDQIANQQQAAQDDLAIAQRTDADRLARQERAQNDELQSQQRFQSESLQRTQQAAQDALHVQQQSQMDAFNLSTQAQVTQLQAQLAGQVAAIDQRTGTTVSAADAAISPAAAGVRQQQEAKLQADIAAATVSQRQSLQQQLGSMQAEDLAAQTNLAIKHVQDQAKLDAQRLQDQQKVQQQALAATQKAQADALQTSQKTAQEALQDSQKTQQEALQDANKQESQALQEHYKELKRQNDAYYDGLKTNMDAWWTLQQADYAKQVKAVNQQYTDETTAYALQAKARQDIESGNQQHIVAMINTYAPDWNTAGRSLGKQLIDGVQASDIPGAVAKILSDAGITPLLTATPSGASPLSGVNLGWLGNRSATEAKNVTLAPGAIQVTVTAPQVTQSDVETAVQQGVSQGISDALNRDASLAGVG